MVLLVCTQSFGPKVASRKTRRKCCPGISGAVGWSDSETENQILSSSGIFRGRIRWSTLLIENLFTGYLRAISNEASQINGASLIKKAAEITQGTIIAQLPAHIEELKEKGQNLLMRDLYFTAVRADLMNKPYIFRNTKSVQMVTEGFALLKPLRSDSNDVLSSSRASRTFDNTGSHPSFAQTGTNAPSEESA